MGDIWTPGPWALHKMPDGRFLIMSVKETINVVGTAMEPFESTPETQEANAHLIANAPELYEALDTLTKEMFLDNNSNAIEAAYDNAVAALSKARGETDQ